MSEPRSTAEQLGAFRKELTEQGFSADETSNLVDMAARELLSQEGLGVKA